jgi:hypothetical protein
MRLASSIQLFRSSFVRFAFRSVLPAATLFVAVLTSGCMTIPDPAVSLDHRAARPVPLKNVLVIVDYKLDVEATGGGAARENVRKQFYGPIGEAMADAVKAAGGTPTLVYVTRSEQLPIASGDYSHVWVQRISNLIRVSGDGGNWVEHLRWRGSLAHRPAPGAHLVNAYEMDYRSDGFRCFGIQVFAGKEECRAKVKALLNSQLNKYLAES